MTGITRRTAAEAVAAFFGTTANYSGGGYSAWKITDREGKEWSLVYDSSIQAQKKVGREYIPVSDSEYKVEMVSPKLEYSEMEKLQDVVRALRHAGAVVGEQCVQHVHIDASNSACRHFASIANATARCLVSSTGAYIASQPANPTEP